jgi:hypothetical protein
MSSFSLSLYIYINSDHLETIDNCVFIEVTKKNKIQSCDMKHEIDINLHIYSRDAVHCFSFINMMMFDSSFSVVFSSKKRIKKIYATLSD